MNPRHIVKESSMMYDVGSMEDAKKRRAHAIWKQTGNDDEVTNWLQAENELAFETATSHWGKKTLFHWKKLRRKISWPHVGEHVYGYRRIHGEVSLPTQMFLVALCPIACEIYEPMAREIICMCENREIVARLRKVNLNGQCWFCWIFMHRFSKINMEAALEFGLATIQERCVGVHKQ